MTTYTFYYPKWVGVIIRSVDKITCIIISLPIAVIVWLFMTKVEFKEKP